MSKWRIHWNDGGLSSYMPMEALIDCIRGEETFVLYIENEDMQPHIDLVLELMQQGHTAMSQWGELLLYRGNDYYIDTRAVFEYEVRAALQVRYTVDPDDYREDQAYVAAAFTHS